jgi:hypothetical protein
LVLHLLLCLEFFRGNINWVPRNAETYEASICEYPDIRLQNSGAYDFVVRAAITGTVAGGTFLVLLVMTNRWVGVSRGENSSKSN